jgi:hypothetical protein
MSYYTQEDDPATSEMTFQCERCRRAWTEVIKYGFLTENQGVCIKCGTDCTGTGE